MRKVEVVLDDGRRNIVYVPEALSQEDALAQIQENIPSGANITELKDMGNVDSAPASTPDGAVASQVMLDELGKLYRGNNVGELWVNRAQITDKNSNANKLALAVGMALGEFPLDESNPYIQKVTRDVLYRESLGGEKPSVQQMLLPEYTQRSNADAGLISKGFGALKDVMSVVPRALRGGAEAMSQDDASVIGYEMARPSMYKSAMQEFADEAGSSTGIASAPLKILQGAGRAATGARLANSTTKAAPLGRAALGLKSPSEAVVSKLQPSTFGTLFKEGVKKDLPYTVSDVGYEMTRPGGGGEVNAGISLGSSLLGSAVGAKLFKPKPSIAGEYKFGPGETLVKDISQAKKYYDVPPSSAQIKDISDVRDLLGKSNKENLSSIASVKGSLEEGAGSEIFGSLDDLSPKEEGILTKIFEPYFVRDKSGAVVDVNNSAIPAVRADVMEKLSRLKGSARAPYEKALKAIDDELEAMGTIARTDDDLAVPGDFDAYSESLDKSMKESEQARSELVKNEEVLAMLPDTEKLVGQSGLDVTKRVESWMKDIASMRMSPAANADALNTIIGLQQSMSKTLGRKVDLMTPAIMRHIDAVAPKISPTVAGAVKSFVSKYGNSVMSGAKARVISEFLRYLNSTKSPDAEVVNAILGE